ncbi:MAG: alpha/beta hydrolase family protein [Chloroflexota bacterium]
MSKTKPNQSVIASPMGEAILAPAGRLLRREKHPPRNDEIVLCPMLVTRLNRLASLVFLLILAACSQISTGGVSSPDLTAAAPTLSESTRTPKPPVSPSPVPTATQTYKQAIYPYTIEGLRQHDYQSGEVTVLGVIEETKDFTSYLIEYPSDGLNIRGVMQIPTRGEPPYPVIVMNHGWFSRTTYRSGDGTTRAAEYLNIHGYLTLSSDYRSWGTSDMGPSIFYSGLAVDVVNLLFAIPSIPQADASRVGLWGHSMGGAVTMKVLTILGDNPSVGAGSPRPTGSSRPVVRAAVLYSTVSADQADVLERWGLGCYGDVLDGEFRTDCNSSDVVPLDLPVELLNAYFHVADNAEMLKSVSPIHHLDLVDAPVQIHYGEWDGEELSGTPPKWSIKLFEALQEAGKPVKLIEYKEQRHSFINEAWYQFMETVVKFFDANVKNAP